MGEGRANGLVVVGVGAHVEVEGGGGSVLMLVGCVKFKWHDQEGSNPLGHVLASKGKQHHREGLNPPRHIAVSKEWQRHNEGSDPPCCVESRAT